MTYFADGGGFFLLVNQDTARVNLDEFGLQVRTYLSTHGFVSRLGTWVPSGPPVHQC
jgi:hypothetical protein